MHGEPRLKSEGGLEDSRSMSGRRRRLFCSLAPLLLHTAASAPNKIPTWLKTRAHQLGYKSLTPIQSQAIPTLLDNKDAILIAPTGSGKTLAYLLPLISLLKPQSSIQALVLAPSRELAKQVAGVARQLVKASPERILVMALLDGSGARRQRIWMKAEPPQLVIGNVEQVDTIFRENLLQFNSLRTLVVDEVDACFSDSSVRPAVQRLLTEHSTGEPGSTRSIITRQTIFVSASLPQRQHFQRQSVQQRWSSTLPVLISPQPDEKVPDQLIHQYAVCESSKRVAALRVLLRNTVASEDNMGLSIVFVRHGRPIERIAQALEGIVEDGAPVILHEDLSLAHRAATICAVRAGSRKILVATPMAARGLDFEQCSHIFLFDIPATAEDYLHAAGRCGRFGRRGRVNVLCSKKETFVLNRVGNALGITFEQVHLELMSQAKG